MMGAERFKANNSQQIVTDLDAVLESPGCVKLHGKEHEIKPVLVGEFFAFANAIAQIEQLKASESVDIDQVVNGYFGVISPICPTITKEDIRRCSASQISALMNLVQEHVMGKLTDEKKKILMMNPAALSRRA